MTVEQLVAIVALVIGGGGVTAWLRTGPQNRKDSAEATIASAQAEVIAPDAAVARANEAAAAATELARTASEQATALWLRISQMEGEMDELRTKVVELSAIEIRVLELADKNERLIAERDEWKARAESLEERLARYEVP